MTLALFRIIEPACGYIEIDGYDICRMGLHDVRTKLTVIAQVRHLLINICCPGVPSIKLWLKLLYFFSSYFHIIIIINEFQSDAYWLQGRCHVRCDFHSVAFSDVRRRMIVGTVPSSALFGTEVDWEDVIDDGRLFHTFASATGKA